VFVFIWACFHSNLDDISELVKAIDDDQRSVKYREHIGGGYY